MEVSFARLSRIMSGLLSMVVLLMGREILLSDIKANSPIGALSQTKESIMQ